MDDSSISQVPINGKLVTMNLSSAFSYGHKIVSILSCSESNDLHTVILYQLIDLSHFFSKFISTTVWLVGIGHYNRKGAKTSRLPVK